MLPRELKWLNAEFVKKVLTTFENDESIEVKNLAIKPAFTAGENYLSHIIRASLEYTHQKSGHEVTEKKSLIIKISPIEEGTAKQLVSDLGVFEMEIEMMEITLAKMNELLNKDDSRLSARVFYAETGNPSFIVMEDLASLGYRMADRHTGLDLEHCITAMRRLAEFHASSVALYEKNPKTMVGCMQDGFQKRSSALVRNFYLKGLKTFAKALLGWSELGSSARNYSEKMLKFADSYYEKGLNYGELTKVNIFKVLNHGDYWVNNMLFRYDDEGKVIDLIFVDFQICWWTSPIMDIIKFFNTSLAEDVDFNYREVLLEEYLNRLTKTMIQLGCSTKPPNLTILKETMEKHQVLEVLPSCVLFILVLNNDHNIKSLDEIIQQNDGYKNSVYEIPTFKKRLLRRLTAWNASGILDV